MTPSCALLVPSWEGYSDLWVPFVNLLTRYWPDCPYEKFIGTGRLPSPCPEEFSAVVSTAGAPWSKCLIDYLQQVRHEYVLVMLEDFFLRSRVPTEDVAACLGFLEENSGLMVRLIARPKPTLRMAEESLIGISELGSPYRICMQAAIWRRDFLLELLDPREEIWEFELKGSQRSNDYPNGVYAVWKSVLPYEGVLAHHVVEKGKWLPHEAWWFGRQDIGCDLSRRGSLSWAAAASYQIGVRCKYLLDDLVPWPLKLRLLRTWRNVRRGAQPH
jgi:hypothetical protein